MSDDDFKRFLGAVARGGGNVAVPSDPIRAVSALRFYGISCLGMDRIEVTSGRMKLWCQRCAIVHDGACKL